jgi:hypothetical protein
MAILAILLIKKKLLLLPLVTSRKSGGFTAEAFSLVGL